ncbi:HD-GYP domain-containing protein [Bacillus timonensis]|nr:HD-GYP domain-containing protein [Bacillus timonensis]
MRVDINHLQEGCILSEDVFSLTNKPIIPKETILQDEHIKVLKAFLINDVKVHPRLHNGNLFKPSELLTENEKNEETQKPFLKQYLSVVKEYKKMFQSWQAGSAVDIGQVRGLLLPLVEVGLENSEEIFKLTQYVNKEEYQFHHSVTVALISACIGKKQNLDKGDVIQLALAGFLSDCGMSKVNPKLLTKSDALSENERKEIQQHPLYSYKMLEKVTLLKDSVKISVFQHHERLDGSGYVLGTKSEKLHLFAKIIAVADVYHAMGSDKPYRSKKPPFKVIEEMNQDGFGKFDVQMVKELTNLVTKLSIGNKVRLSNGYIGEVVYKDEMNSTRPMVKMLETEEIIQLIQYRHLYIEEVL